MLQCNEDCNSCEQLNTESDSKGNILWYDCIKYRQSVRAKDFKDTKDFLEESEFATTFDFSLFKKEICHFCGSNNLGVEELSKPDDKMDKNLKCMQEYFHITCYNCACYGPGADTIEQAFDLWKSVRIKNEDR